MTATPTRPRKDGHTTLRLGDGRTATLRNIGAALVVTQGRGGGNELHREPITDNDILGARALVDKWAASQAPITTSTDIALERARDIKRQIDRLDAIEQDVAQYTAAIAAWRAEAQTIRDAITAEMSR